MIKIDLLSVECLDKIHICLDLLADQGYIVPEETLRETYEKYLGIYNIERNDPKMWEMVHKHEIQSLFQVEKQSGVQGIALIKPTSVDDLAVLNSVIRLMAQDKESEQPVEMWAKYRKNPKLWIQQMENYGLTQDEIDWLSHHSSITDGICESQEGLMQLVQEPRLGGNSLTFADKCRKGLAKKIGSLFDECENIFYENVKKNNCSEKLAHYVWDVLLRVQRGYSFNRSHCLAYSLVALQEMNLAFKFPIIFWNCACLITDSGGAENNGNGTDYTKIARAMGKMIQSGIKIEPPNVRTSLFTFYPDVENNRILFGLRGILNVGDDVIDAIIKNRPYTSPKDFLNKVKPNKQAMISLIKSGAFDEMEDRKFVMTWYIWEKCDKKKNITLSNMPSLIKYNLLPQVTEEEILARRVYEFNRYLKAVCKHDSVNYLLDQRAINFLFELEVPYLIKDGMLNAKLWDKTVYQKHMDVFRNWIAENKSKILNDLNMFIFKEAWENSASGTISAWEMEALCFYYHEHELAHANNERYGFVDFYKLPEDPIVESHFKRGGKDINIFKLHRICGTCIAKDKDKGIVSLLTTTGVVNVKFRKEYFSLFDKQISIRLPDNKKKVVEKSWFNRGQMIAITGIRSGDNFISKKYASTNSHQLYRISKVLPNGELVLQDSRYQGGEYEDEV